MEKIKAWVKAHWKGLGGAVSAAGTALVAAWPDGITGDEWRNIAIAALAGFGITWAVPANKKGPVA